MIKIFIIRKIIKLATSPGADPGFPVGEGADPLGGASTYDFVKFSEKLHEIEKILGCRGARAGCPRNPPLLSCKRPRRYHRANMTQVTEKFFKMTTVYQSVIYQNSLNFSSLIFVGHMSIFGTTYTPIADFWCCLL